MPRKGPAQKRVIQPDPIYQNPLVTQLINKILMSGKKSVAERAVYRALRFPQLRCTEPFTAVLYDWP